MNVTMKDVRAEALATIKELRERKIDFKEANTVKLLLDVIVDTAKAEIEAARVIAQASGVDISPDDVKAICSGTENKTYELDKSLEEIERSNNNYIPGGK